MLSYYNLISIGLKAQTRKSWNDFANDLDTIDLEDPYLGFGKGVCRSNTGQRDQAVRAWKLNFEKHGWNAASSLAALIHTH
ncbi:MAG: hypothetical protein ACJ07L_09125 [Opitutales bacterium]